MFSFKKIKSDKGFTLVELMIITAISAVLFGIVTVNLVRFQNNASRQSNIDVLVSDLKSQQLKAMLGSTEGRAANDNYGIYFMADRYILFHGNTYNPNDPTNFTVNLPADVRIQSTTLPNNSAVFSKLSGELLSYSPSANTITVHAVSNNENSVISLNRYGVITGVN
jgi:prepilin-type N-terminal cleavage/methylation domain-containing protein